MRVGSAGALAATGGVLGAVLADTRWVVVGAVAGAVAGAFAPLVPDALRGRHEARELWSRTREQWIAGSPAALLDPRDEVVSFSGRESELAALTSWCNGNDESPSRLRLVTGGGGVGKTRLAVELSARMRRVGWVCERIGDGQ